MIPLRFIICLHSYKSVILRLMILETFMIDRPYDVHSRTIKNSAWLVDPSSNARLVNDKLL